MKSISSESVLGLIMSMITSISSLMLFCLFSQYSSKIVVRVRPKLSWASSHFKCRVELTTGTWGVRFVRNDLGMDLLLWHFFK